MEKSKQFKLLLPENHPIFSYPVRSRAAIARELLDIGLRLQEIKDGIDSINQEIKHRQMGTYTPDEKQEEQPLKIDVDELLKYFE
ncbi:MAG: hypothetical protein PHN69_04670 [Candidatus Pacebacteria bacterium]|nr:hypothetical protein [Candidatus Paceibacterota bacterium]